MVQGSGGAMMDRLIHHFGRHHNYFRLAVIPFRGVHVIEIEHELGQRVLDLLIQGMHDVIQKYPGVLGDVSLLEEYFLIGPNGPNDAEEANSLIPCNGSPQRCYSMILDLFPRYGRVFFLFFFSWDFPGFERPKVSHIVLADSLHISMWTPLFRFRADTAFVVTFLHKE